MALFKRDKPPKDPHSPEFMRYMAKKLDGRKVRFALEREGDTDKIIGKDGFISVYEGFLSVICGEKTLFKAKVDTIISFYEFLSLEGAIITAFDVILEKERTIMAYYKYFHD